MSLPRFGAVKPEHVLAQPEWRGAVVSEPQMHDFQKPHSRATEAALAWQITNGTAELWLRCEQPDRAPYVVTVTSAKRTETLEVQSQSAADRVMREMMREHAKELADGEPTPDGFIARAGRVSRFSWNGFRRQVRRG